MAATVSPYRLRARAIISAVLAALPANATEADARRALRGKNPWSDDRAGSGNSWPSKCWRKEVGEQFANYFRDTRRRAVTAWRCTSYGVNCGWCDGKPFKSDGWNSRDSTHGCLVCRGDPLKLSPEWLTWNDGTVPKIARSILSTVRWIEDKRRVDDLPVLADALPVLADALPVLADALEEAGATDELLIAHFRLPDLVHLEAGCGVLKKLAGH